MAHDIFISYSKTDKLVADAVCAVLESEKIHCWIAPRNILPGTNYPEAIIMAIKNCKVFILIFSAHSNDSLHVRTEVEKAMNCRIPIIPLRIADVPLSPHMEYFIGSYQWLDALTSPFEKHLLKLTLAVQSLLHINQPALSDNNIIQELHHTLNEKNHEENQNDISAVSESSFNQPNLSDNNTSQELQHTLNEVNREENQIAVSTVSELGSEFSSFEQNKLRLIPGGEFYYKKYRRKVKVEPFFIGICPVTNQEYEQFDPEHKKQRNEHSSADDEPVIYISWNDANRYCEWLSKETGKTFRLPDEVEWEYACRAGSTGSYSLDIDGMEVNEKNLKKYAVYGTPKTMPVKQRKPNSFGLYDMHGNVWEWCRDCHEDNNNNRVLRGGSWSSQAEHLGSSFRIRNYPVIKVNNFGFRVVVSILRTQS
ncbi:MAG TPA: SUMF1/EgtB/PvdO family nonheme iron enzyme [Bacillota bacterium]|nr:SUMF1/EgtB/PvdO family nonheme iron enzyme [Bacillota bacterium]